MSSPCRLSLLALALLILAACEREARTYRGPSRPPDPRTVISPTDFQPGGFALHPPNDPNAIAYERNAFHINEGKRYYEWYNCYGCHAAGGGAIGPPLMDDAWRYGDNIEQIHASIMEGRPNGMPAFRNRLPDQQAWEIAAYVRSLSGNAPKDAVPSRGDEVSTGEAKTQFDKQPPKALQDPSQQGLPQ